MFGKFSLETYNIKADQSGCESVSVFRFCVFNAKVSGPELNVFVVVFWSGPNNQAN